MSHYNPQGRQKTKIFTVTLLLIAAVSFVIFSPHFERGDPQISFVHKGFWNLSSPLDIVISDNLRLKHYRVTLKNGDELLTLADENSDQPRVTVTLKDLEIKNPPQPTVELTVTATDASFWHFFAGNAIEESFTLSVDRRNPTATVVAHSYGIALGGSALVVFEAQDEHLAEIKVITKSGKSFAAAPFYAENFYAALIGREINDKDFAAFIYASDIAGNQTRVRIPFFSKDAHYRQSNVKLTQSFLEGKVDDLNFAYNKVSGAQNLSLLEKFLFVNETLRNASFELIEQVTTPHAALEPITHFEPSAFAPLFNGARVANFGDRRDFFYDGVNVSHSYHLGLDLASVKEASVKVTNGGAVVFAGDNGVYGNMPVVHHGLGLYSLYGHCTRISVSEGARVQAAQEIGTTGTSGFALGDHTHFETRVQGVAVTPIEWMDPKWIRVNIGKVQDDAKLVIDGRSK